MHCAVSRYHTAVGVFARGGNDGIELALGKHAAYLWCADGIHASKLQQAFTRATEERATARNWTTVLKLQAMLG